MAEDLLKGSNSTKDNNKGRKDEREGNEGNPTEKLLSRPTEKDWRKGSL